jgi:hypothetical protein
MLLGWAGVAANRHPAVITITCTGPSTPSCLAPSGSHVTHMSWTYIGCSGDVGPACLKCSVPSERQAQVQSPASRSCRACTSCAGVATPNIPAHRHCLDSPPPGCNRFIGWPGLRQLRMRAATIGGCALEQRVLAAHLAVLALSGYNRSSTWSLSSPCHRGHMPQPWKEQAVGCLICGTLLGYRQRQ